MTTTFKPNSASHSIEQAIVGIRLLEDAPDSAYDEAVHQATELQEAFDLPGRIEADPMALVFGRQSLTVGYRSGPPEMKPGMVFQRVNRSGVMEAELTVERSAVTFRTRDYDRWRDMQRFIQGLLAPVAASLSGGDVRKVTTVELRCVDKFVSDSKSACLTDLVDVKSDLVPEWLKGRQNLLHSHIGWFEDVTEFGRTLVNLNVTLSEAGNKKIGTILQVISSQSNGTKSTYFGRKKFERLLIDVTDKLHSRDKALLGNLLNRDLIKLIDLTGDSGVASL